MLLAIIINFLHDYELKDFLIKIIYLFLQNILFAFSSFLPSFQQIVTLKIFYLSFILCLILLILKFEKFFRFIKLFSFQILY